MMADTRAEDGARARDPEQAAIEIQDLVADYGRKRAVDGLSLRVPVGSVYGFLGPNGAGKTTTIKTLLGPLDFVACMSTAAAFLLVALWLFDRKAY